jgi:photosystem II stability/assembly factor-like uncharacterized protein
VKVRAWLLAFLLLAGLLAGCGPTTAPPPGQDPDPQPIQFHWLHMTATGGWARTDDALWHSGDGGTTWQKVSPVADQEPLVHSLGATTAWVLRPGADGQQGELARTTDGGQTWDRWPVPFAGAHLTFVDPDTGWALVPQGVAAGSMAVALWSTADGGRTWAPRTGTPPAGSADAGTGHLPLGGLKDGIAFRSANVGWVSGGDYAPGHVWLYVTHDGGQTWQPQELALPADLTEAMVTTGTPRFFSPTDGLLPVRANAGEVVEVWYRTTDGGETWVPGPVLRDVAAYDWVDATHGFITDGVRLQATADGGQTWSVVQKSDELAGVFQLDFVDTQLGYALVRQGAVRLVRTTDGGKTWTAIDFGSK